jgi:ATP-dependent Lhr-like helicase
LDEAPVLQALEALEAQGVVLRGKFRHDATDTEWCERALLARIHRYTLNRLRAEIEPVSPADYMRFVFDWQHVAPLGRLSGVDGLRHILRTLDGFEVPASAWEGSVLPCRMDKYDPAWLDMLCLTGYVGWARVSKPQGQNRLVRTTAIAMFLREHANAWSRLAAATAHEDVGPMLTTEAHQVLTTLATRGALFAHELASTCGLDTDIVSRSLGELVSAGLVASDGFAGLRALIADKDVVARDSQMAGRWSVVGRGVWSSDSARATADTSNPSPSAPPDDALVETQARVLLRRYGVVCRRVIAREPNAQPWRVLARVYRTLEARGDIRGGRFVAGLAGEQFALPEAVERLREIRRTAPDDKVTVISAADPLNLAGIVTVGDRVPAIASTRIAYRNGVPMAALEGDYIRPLAEMDASVAGDVASALAGRRVPPIVSGFVGRVS